MYPREILEHVYATIGSEGFFYPKRTIANLYLSLKTKPFVILAGISGTGKTQLAKQFAAALGHEERFQLIPVKPDWTDSSFILGYTNSNGEFVEGPLWHAMQKAKAQPDMPFFVLFDEMNLARVEYYLSDLLSLIETRKLANGHILSSNFEHEGQTWNLPDNLYMIGTINIDEASHSLSRKVLDRANVIEMNEIHLDGAFQAQEAVESREPISNDFLQAPYVHIKDIAQADLDRNMPVIKLLTELNKLLWQIDLPIGYRIRDEILFYLANRHEIRELISEGEAVDLQIHQKILPRIYGSSRTLYRVLFEIIALLTQNDKLGEVALPYAELQKLIGDPRKKQIPYPRSVSKLMMMMRRLEENGYTSFWL
ncbi:MAG: AAA family ATPase [Bacteroidia bacterium]|nr:AAA family ATPase [Bacteroidia bacterium]